MALSTPPESMLIPALDALNRLTGIRGEVIETDHAQSDRVDVDATIRLHAPTGVTYDYVVEIKPRINSEMILASARTQMLRAAHGDLERALLVTRHLSPAQLDACRSRLDLQALDMAGNAYIRRDDLYVLIRGQRPDPTQLVETPSSAGTVAWLRVVYTLLTQPEHRSASYRELAAAAGVALGSVGPVLRDLEHRNLMIAGEKERLLVEPERLLTEWVTTYPTRLRPKLGPQRLRSEHPGWWATEQLPPGAMWGGEIAADRLTHYLKPQHATIYVPPAARSSLMSHLVARHRLRADPAGDVEVLDTLTPREARTPVPGVVHPLLVYADLLATLIPRNIEVANMVRERHLDPVLR
jgi:hypothetical protein